MQTQTENQGRKKLNPTRKLLAEGESLKVEFIGRSEKTNEISGEVFSVYNFRSIETGEPLTLRGSAGLRQALQDAMITEGQKIEIMRLTNITNKKGHPQSVYDIYGLE